jgi:PAS domain S-box-containing protein
MNFPVPLNTTLANCIRGKRVLLICSYNAVFPTFADQYDGLRRGLDSPDTTIDIEFMDAKRFSNPSDIEMFRRHFAYKYINHQPYDLVMTADDAALEFTLKHRSEFFSNIPVVFFGLNNLDLAEKMDAEPMITGVAEMVSISETLELMFQLKPESKNVIAISDSTISGQSDLKTFSETIHNMNRDIKTREPFTHQILDLSHMTWNEFEKALKNLPMDSQVLLLSAYRDSNGEALNFDESLKLINQNLRQPLYHLWKHGLGSGILGGRIISHFEQARKAAEIGHEILCGQSVSDFRVIMKSPNIVTVDHNELVRFGIQESALPEGTAILNRKNSFYQQNRPAVIAASSIIMVLSILVTILTASVKRIKIAERKLEEEKEFMTKSINSIPGIFYVLNSRGRFIRWNENLSLFSGRSNEELAELTAFDLHSPEYHETIRHSIESILLGKSVNVELEAIRANGERPHYFHKASPVINNSELFIVGTAIDITDLKKTTQRLQQSEEKFRRIFESMPEGYILARADGEIVLANPAAARLLGHTCPETMEGLNIGTEFYANIKDREHLLEILKEKGRAPEFEMTFMRHDRSCFIAEASVHLVQDEDTDEFFIEGLFKDVTRRKEDEHKILQMATAIDQAFEGVMITDLKGTITYVNPSFERISGYTSAEIMGKNPRVLSSGKSDRHHHENLWSTISSGLTWVGTLINRHKNGSLYEIRATISPIRDPEGKIVNFVAVNQDITQEKRLENMLYQSQKMEALGTLAGGIAHDFNNILGAITGYTELCMDEVSNQVQATRLLESVMQASHRAEEMVRQILAFSKMKEIEKKPVAMGLLLDEIILFLNATLPKNIEITKNFHITGNRDFVLADSTQIQQVLMNLCTNAGHAMAEKGGTLTIGLSRTSFSPYPGSPENQNEKEWIQLSISDTGPGIGKETLRRIFEPYFTTRINSGGTGLGLAVVHGIIKNHNGEITVESFPGRGTVFHVYLPVDRSDEKIIRTAALPRILPCGTEKILLVDDDEALLDVLRRRLEKLGYNVVATTSPAEALEKIKSELNYFDLLLTDKTMPVMDGFQLVREIRTLGSKIPIILCTGSADSRDSAKIPGLKINDIMTKPVGKNSLACTVRKVLDDAG